MSTFRELFSAHPESVGESYFEHLCTACSFASYMFVGAVVCLCHAFLPFLFTQSGSSIIARLNHKMLVARSRNSAEPGLMEAQQDARA